MFKMTLDLCKFDLGGGVDYQNWFVQGQWAHAAPCAAQWLCRVDTYAPEPLGNMHLDQALPVADATP